MPLDRLVLILIAVIAAAGATVLVGALLATVLELPAVGLTAALPVLMIGYVLWRVIADRIANKADDRYDRIEK